MTNGSANSSCMAFASWGVGVRRQSLSVLRQICSEDGVS